MAPRWKNSIPRWLLRVAVFPCLAAWLLIRLWVPFDGVFKVEAMLAAALVLSALLLFLTGFFGLADRLLLVWEAPWKTLLLSVPFLLLGYFFDISYSMLYGDPPDLSLLPFPVPLELLCRLGNAVVVAVIALALIHAGRDLWDLGRADRLQLAVIFVCLNLVTALYAFTSHTVYVWDNAGYWSIARTLAQEELNYDHLIRVLETTLTLDYNHLLAFPISLVMRVFGGSRAVFLFALSDLYVFPGLWGLTVLANKRRWSGLVMAGLFPMLGYTGLVGFVDVICCAMGIWAYIIYTSDKPAASRGIFTGFLLVLSFLCRRYFLFFAASFGAAAFVVKLLFQRKRWGDLIALFGSCAVCSLAFAYSFLLGKVLSSDYESMYSAYDLGLMTDLLYFCRYFGLALLILFLAAALTALAREDDRPKIVLGLTQVVVCFVAFVQIQTHGQQHLLLYLPALAFLTVTGLSRAPQFLSSMLAMATAVYCFFPKLQPLTMGDIDFPALFPSFHFYGPERSDLNELGRLVDFIDGLSVEEPQTAAVLSSSFTFNSETISSYRSSLDLPEPQVRTTIQYHGTVDKRDSFNWNTVSADYLIVGDPVQVHLGEENQQIMAILAHAVLDGAGPGRAYRELPDTFQLANGVTVRVYKLERAWTLQEYYDISDALMELYPDYAELYDIPDWLK